jgi:hypothetical protein
MRSKILWLIFLSLLSTFLPACTGSASVLTEDEQAIIYTAVIRQIYLLDNTADYRRFPVIYLPRYTDDTAGDPRVAEPNAGLIPETVQAEVLAALDGLRADFIWIEGRNEVIDKRIMVVKDDGAIITVGNIYLQKDGKVLVAASIYFSSEGAGGMTYIIEKIDDTWRITGNTGATWIS